MLAFDDTVIDRLGALLRALDAISLNARVGLADAPNRVLEASGNAWWEIEVAFKAGVEALVRRIASGEHPQTLAWAYGPDWEAQGTGSDGRRAFRYTHPDWGTVAQVRECRGTCPCFPRDGHPTRWHAFIDVPDEPPLTYPGVSCFAEKLAAQLAVYAQVMRWGEPPCPEDDPEFQAFVAARAATLADGADGA
jgi:hypothetical protein